MKHLIFLSCILAFSACNPDEDPAVAFEQWKPVFPEITDPILDSRVNGDEWQLITNAHFYRIKHGVILEKRDLTDDRYNNYSSPIIGHNLIFRLINFDSVAFLEFQPIQPGGNTVRVSYDELGDDKLTFPITHGFGGRNTGRFDTDDNFLFAGYDYPSIQQFVTILKINYDRVSNTILDIDIAERHDLNPIPIAEWDNPYIEDVLEADGVIFINARNSGVYRYFEGNLQYMQDMTGEDLIGVDIERDIFSSSDKGVSWDRTGFSLSPGSMLEKAGEYYVSTNEWNQLHNIGKQPDQMNKFLFFPSGPNPFTYAILRFYDEHYFLIGNIEDKYQIFQKSKLED